MSMGDTSIQAVKVVMSLTGYNDFRPYSTFADPLGWGLFVTFVWAVMEAWRGGRSESVGTTLVRRIFFVSCLVMTLSRTCILAGVAMCFFSWVLKRRIVGRPFVFIVGFSLAFVGVVTMVQYLLEHVENAQWLPQWTSSYMQRFFEIGTLTQRGYAIDELWKAMSKYGIFGVGWKDQGSLTVGTIGWLPEFQSHNGLVNLFVAVGGVGVVLVLTWFVTWIRLTGRMIRCCPVESEPCLRWAVAMILGYATTVFFSGQQFLNEFFWLFVGWTTTLATQVKMGGGASSCDPNFSSEKPL
jgi:hypothetical protein